MLCYNFIKQLHKTAHLFLCPSWEWSIVMSMFVSFVCPPQSYLRNHTFKLHWVFSAWACGHGSVVLQYVTYFAIIVLWITSCFCIIGSAAWCYRCRSCCMVLDDGSHQDWWVLHAGAAQVDCAMRHCLVYFSDYSFYYYYYYYCYYYYYYYKGRD